MRVEADRPDDGTARLRVQVGDTGIGIAPQQLAQLFEPFTQADTSTTRRFGGTGLGLAISRRLVSIMGGELAADSEPGRGSTFQVRDHARRASTPSARAGARGRACPGDTRVLVVDDNATNREILRAYLREPRRRLRRRRRRGGGARDAGGGGARGPALRRSCCWTPRCPR